MHITLKERLGVYFHCLDVLTSRSFGATRGIYNTEWYERYVILGIFYVYGKKCMDAYEECFWRDAFLWSLLWPMIGMKMLIWWLVIHKCLAILNKRISWRNTLRRCVRQSPLMSKSVCKICNPGAGIFRCCDAIYVECGQFLLTDAITYYIQLIYKIRSISN